MKEAPSLSLNPTLEGLATQLRCSVTETNAFVRHEKENAVTVQLEFCAVTVIAPKKSDPFDSVQRKKVFIMKRRTTEKKKEMQKQLFKRLY